MSGRARGFTLLEVLVALAIVAMSVGALLGTITSSASNIIYLKDKTMAEWVALNRLTELRIDKNFPDVGKKSGESVMGGVKWEWQQEIVELPIKGLFRIDVRSHSTGENVDDTKPVTKPAAQTLTPSTASGSEKDKIAWTSTVTGVVGSARSSLPTAVATPIVGSTPSNPGNPGGGPTTPGAPNTPGSPTIKPVPPSAPKS